MLHASALVVYSQVPQKPGFDKIPVEGEAYFYALETERLFERMVQLNGVTSLPFGDAVLYATVLQWLGKGDQARKLVEPMVSQEPNLASLSFAQLLDMQGDRKEAIRVLQRGLLFALIESSNILHMLTSIYGDDEEHLSAVYNLARQLTANWEYIAVSPTTMPIITLAMAESAARRGRADETLGYLRVYVDDLDECCEFMRRPRNPLLFDGISDLMWKEDDADLHVTCEESVAALRHEYQNRLMTDEVWKEIADNAEFRKIISAIGAKHE